MPLQALHLFSTCGKSMGGPLARDAAEYLQYNDMKLDIRTTRFDAIIVTRVAGTSSSAQRYVGLDRDER